MSDFYFKICSTSAELKLKLSSSTSKVKYILFDCDGLLLDTESLYSQAAIELIHEYLQDTQTDDFSHKCTDTSLKPSSIPAEVKLSVMGRTKEQIGSLMSAYLKQSYNIEIDPEDWTSRVTVKENHLFSLGCDLLPGAQELINHTKFSSYLPIVLATSSYRSAFQIKSIKHSDFFEQFDHIVCGDELVDAGNEFNVLTGNNIINLSKPHPRIFELSRLKVSSTINGIVFEDSLNGVIAGLRSGHPVIWIPSAEIKHISNFDLLNQTIKDIPEAVDDIKKNPDVWVFKSDSLLEVLECFK